MVELELIAAQTILTMARAFMQTTDPTPEQLAALDAAEQAIKTKLDLDLAKVAGQA